jgi:polar amino acid transport system substrate-binding protein
MGNKSLVQKALARPDLVRKLADRARRDGIREAVRIAQTRLSEPATLGYSCAGKVLAVGTDVSGIRVGDRVACAGAGYANHSEINLVPQNLVTPIPDEVTCESGAFTTVGSIALQAVRLTEATLGSRVAVVGLGLVGQLAIRVLKVAGCQVVGVDIDPESVQLATGCSDLALDSGKEDVASAISRFTDGYGVDATLIAASTSSDHPIELAGEITREKGRVVIVGAVGMDIPREPYYMKEIEVVVSRSYGPGRYDATYEEGGIDYPLPYVRFTEQRNMETVVEMIRTGRLDVDPLITHRFPFEEAIDACRVLTEEAGVRAVGIVLQYSDREIDLAKPVRLTHKFEVGSGSVGIGMIGAGNYATSTLLPILSKDARVDLRGICSASGLTAQTAGSRFGFHDAMSSSAPVVTDENTHLIMITTRHDSHASNAISALEAGKHVYVEKPLCLTSEELVEIEKTYAGAGNGISLTVGFNRRFSSFVQDVLQHYTTPTPKVIHIRVNAGSLPQDHWQNDPLQGGGRILGEVCHFLDLLCYLAGSPARSLAAAGMGKGSARNEENAVISVSFEDGSVGSIVYTSQGDSRFPKERVEVFGSGSVAVIEDFVSGEIVSGGKSRKLGRREKDKGQAEMLKRLVDSLASGGPPIIPFEDLVQSTHLSLLALESLASGKAIAV